MKYYVTEDTNAMIGDYNSHILIKANNKKEALEKMWIALGYDNQSNTIAKGYELHYKKEFRVTELDKWFTKTKYGDSDVAVIH